MKKYIKIEAIPNFAAKGYSFIARRSPCIRDIHQEVVEDVCARISSGKILDIGTGPGYVPFEIAKRSVGLEITGIDLSSAMVEIATRSAQDLGLAGRVSFKVANAGSLPFRDGYFDCVISTLSLHHWLNPTEYLKEIHRVLKEKGQVYIYDLRRDRSKEVNVQVRKKYGWFLAFLFLKIIMVHSSITLREAQDILASLKVSFSQAGIEEKGVILMLQLVK